MGRAGIVNAVFRPLPRSYFAPFSTGKYADLPIVVADDGDEYPRVDSGSPKPAPGVPTRRVADFRSDTVTKPTAQMTIAMIDAVVGDDVYGEDPTANKLEAVGAALLEKEAACFVPTSTMAGLIALGAWLRRGEEVILGDESHVFVYEQGGVSWIMGGVFRTLPNAEDGTFPLQGRRSVAEAIASRPDDQHYARVGAITIENTHNRCGGRVLPLEWIDDLCAIAKESSLPVHMDGARLMNAAAASGKSAARITRGMDSVSLCLSKGLGAPAGALVIGSAAFVAQARRLRKAVGGGMRQVGVLAASGLVALKEHPKLLVGDHARAKSLARGLAAIPGMLLSPETVKTNIVFFDVDTKVLSIAAFQARLAAGGGRLVEPSTGEDVSLALVDAASRGPPGSASALFAALLERIGGARVGSYGTSRLRAVTHHQLGDGDVEALLEAAAAASSLMRRA